MQSRLMIFPAAFIYLLLISATSVNINHETAGRIKEYNYTLPLEKTTIKAKKYNFFQRLMIKLFFKKYQKGVDQLKADKLAGTALVLGIAACAFVVLGLFVPYVIFAAIPVGIVAMIMGGSAVRNGTSKEGSAKTGKALGLGALIAFAVVLIAVVILVASFNSWN